MSCTAINVCTSGVADFNYFLLKKVNRFMNKIINVISHVIYRLYSIKLSKNINNKNIEKNESTTKQINE